MSWSFARRARLEVAGLTVAAGGVWCAVLGVGQGLRSGAAVSTLDAGALVDFAAAGAEFMAPLAVITGATLAAMRWRGEGALTAAQALGHRPERLLWSALWPTSAACALLGAWTASEVGPRRLDALRGRVVARVLTAGEQAPLRGALATGGAWVVRPESTQSGQGAPRVELAVPAAGGLTWISARLSGLEPLTLTDAEVWSPALHARAETMLLREAGLSPWSLDTRHVTPTTELDLTYPRHAFIAHRRVANPLAALPFAALAAWLAARCPAAIAAVTIACGLGAYHAIVRAFEQAARVGDASPLTAWSGAGCLAAVACLVYGLAGRGAVARAAR